MMGTAYDLLSTTFIRYMFSYYTFESCWSAREVRFHKITGRQKNDDLSFAPV
jgi:hypothetical protein